MCDRGLFLLLFDRRIMKFTSLVLVLSIFILISVNAQLEAKYHTNEELHEYMINFTIRFPYISTVYSIGQSVRGKNINTDS